jgi:hypothetical protein
MCRICSLQGLQGLEQHVLSNNPSKFYDAEADAGHTTQNRRLSRVADDAALVEDIPVTTDSTHFSASSLAACSDIRSSGNRCSDEEGNNALSCKGVSCGNRDSIDEILRSGYYGQQVSCNGGLPINKITTWPGKAKMRKYVLAMPELPPPPHSRPSSPAAVRLAGRLSGGSASGGRTSWQGADRADTRAASHSESWDNVPPQTSAGAANGLLSSAAGIFGAGLHSFGFSSFGKSFW